MTTDKSLMMITMTHAKATKERHRYLKLNPKQSNPMTHKKITKESQIKPTMMMKQPEQEPKRRGPTRTRQEAESVPISLRVRPWHA